MMRRQKRQKCQKRQHWQLHRHLQDSNRVDSLVLMSPWEFVCHSSLRWTANRKNNSDLKYKKKKQRVLKGQNKSGNAVGGWINSEGLKGNHKESNFCNAFVYNMPKNIWVLCLKALPPLCIHWVGVASRPPNGGWVGHQSEASNKLPGLQLLAILTPSATTGHSHSLK